MRRLIRFYENKYPANDRVFYMIDDMINYWSDYRFQVRKNYINWLFPLESDIHTKMTPGLRYKFQNNPELRRQVISSVIRYMLFLGYTIKIEDGHPVDVEQIKPLYREENNVIIGLYNTTNYARITRILTFLQDIRMQGMATLFFLMLCRAIVENPDLKYIIKNQRVFKDWIRTQPYLADNSKKIQKLLFNEEEEWENNSEDSKENDAW